jgi:Flp pilus assembly pilin Flp
MSELYKKVRAFVKDEEGLELPEYAVMTALIIAAIIAAIALLSAAISGRFTGLAGVISGIGGP